MDISVVVRIFVGFWISEFVIDRRVLCFCGFFDYFVMLFFWVYICKIKVYNNIIRGFVVVVCMVNLFLFLFVVEGGFIKDI